LLKHQRTLCERERSIEISGLTDRVLKRALITSVAECAIEEPIEGRNAEVSFRELLKTQREALLK
jgi:hypothetical protein